MRRSNFALRLQPSLMDELRKAAEMEGVALNQLISVAVAEKVSALRTEEYFRERGGRADRRETLRILGRAGKGSAPVAGDELPEELLGKAVRQSAKRGRPLGKRREGLEGGSPAAGSPSLPCDLVGRSPAMQKLYGLIAKVADSPHTVLILGEGGAGKETIARCIHVSSRFRDKAFIRVNCGSVDPELLEGRLLGYAEKARAGAERPGSGLLSIAGGGTVLLSGVEQMSTGLQEKLLRAMQEKSIQPLGGTVRVPISVRILAASDAHLEHAVTEGKLRRDLYYRLNVLSLRVPPLRERREDIPLLVTHFLDRARHQHGTKKGMSDEALNAMLAYDWPGNVGELKSCTELAYVSAKSSLIQLDNLPQVIADVGKMQKARRLSNFVPVAEQEKLIILKALAELDGDRLIAARMLGVDTAALYRKPSRELD